MSAIRLRPASGPATIGLSLAAATGGGRGRWQRALAAGASLLLVWHERARQRRHLCSLSDHMLRDLGLGRADVEAEVSKPFWRP